ncbi:hypothetical protein NLU13_5046 [Sarocladium strictum]|uniref:Uncharacterized protein n=1 Tax=Sarocladium strictum TaxID=5046 RepID=A0AA39L9A0_SARSR|nr:hypothetical protein NLU13_5046 [Sarocladium strictum]
MAARFLSVGAIMAAVASAAPAPTGGASCLSFCNSALDACNAAATVMGNPNHPLCASWYSQCLGYNPFAGTYVTPTACAAASAAPPVPTSTGAPDACASACIATFNSCSASQGQCGYEFSRCLGESPFYSGAYVAPAACSSYKETAAVTGAATVTTVVTGYTTYCPGPTSIVHNNKTIIVSTATTLTVTDCPCTITTNAPPAPQPTDCLSKCNAAHVACQNAPGANMATCAAQYAGCLGYNPWGSGSYVAPTACAAPTSAAPVNPTQAPAPPAPQPTDCLSKCNAAHVACQNAPGANMATCAAQYAGCLGYNPWGSGSYVAPTACAAPTTTGPVTVPTGAAGRVVIPGALAALGALALL